jgi:hypothetical protein
VDAELDVEVGGALGEQLDESRCRVLGEETRRGDAQEPSAGASPSYFQDGPILQAEEFGGAAGQAEPAGGERQTARRAGERAVAEFPAQMRDVRRDRGLGDGEIGRGGLHRPEAYGRREGPQLCRGQREPPRSPRVTVHL